MAIGSEDLYGPQAVRSHAWVQTSASAFPIGFIVIQRYLKWRWAAPAAAGLYMLNTILLMQVFQLFPATPEFGPVFHRVDDFLPPMFPMLLVVPALVLAPLTNWAAEERGLKSGVPPGGCVRGCLQCHQYLLLGFSDHGLG